MTSVSISIIIIIRIMIIIIAISLIVIVIIIVLHGSSSFIIIIAISGRVIKGLHGAGLPGKTRSVDDIGMACAPYLAPGRHAGVLQVRHASSRRSFK